MSTFGNQGQPYQPPQQASSGTSVVKIVMIVMAVLVGACVCCGIAMYFGVFALFGALDAQVYEEIKAIPAVTQHFGPFEEEDVSVEVMETVEWQKEHPEYAKNGQVFLVHIGESEDRLLIRQNGQKFSPVGIVGEDGEVTEIQ